jgi:SMC interacting uncharacterized protein involved in chromosome segregation
MSMHRSFTPNQDATVEAFTDFLREISAALEKMRQRLKSDKSTLVDKLRKSEKTVERLVDSQTQGKEDLSRVREERDTLRRTLTKREHSIQLLILLIQDRRTAAQGRPHKVGKDRKKELEAHLKAEQRRLLRTSEVDNL